MKTVKVKYDPQTDRPKCSECGRFVDDGSAVLEYLCRDCFVHEMNDEIMHLLYETSVTCKIGLYDLLHSSGMFTALRKFREIATGREK